MLRPVEELAARLEVVLGSRVMSLRPLTGGMIAEVIAVTLADETTVVAKLDTSGAGRLDIEAAMLRHLRQRSALPVPTVLYADQTLLVMEHINGSSVTTAAEPHLAELLAALHAITSDAFGFDGDSLSGTLVLPSPWTSSWVNFYRDHRLRHTARAALGNGTLYARVAGLADRLESWLDEPEQPSLIHGDVWRNNVLAVGPSVSGLIDPSTCYAHFEQELAYMALFDGFSPRFFDAYAALRPIDRDFWRIRKDTYQLYPLLLHVYFFGTRHLPALDDTLRRLDG